jgi:hypothetical protein
MQREEREANPDRNNIRNIIFGVKIRSPTIEVHTPGAHEIRSASEYEISICFVFEKKTKKPLPQRKCERLPFRWGFQFLSIQIAIARGDGQIPVNCPMSACSTNLRARALEVPWTCTEGISSSFFTNFGGVCLLVLGSEAMREAKAATSLEESEGEGSGGPEASPGEGGMHAEGGRSGQLPSKFRRLNEDLLW